MDFIDNLLNHMSSKFNQESTLPKQAEISMDETFKWRALKNNQFASRSRNGRLKNKSKDKEKQNKTSCELNTSSDENNKSDSSQGPTIAETHASADIEIEIANDISGAEIQEVLASTQGNAPVLSGETSEVREVCLDVGNETIKIVNDSGTIQSSTCTSNGKQTSNEVLNALVHSENEENTVQKNFAIDQQRALDHEIVDELLELVAPTRTKHNDISEKRLFIHMSSTFNGPCLITSSADDTLIENPQISNQQTLLSSLQSSINNDNESESNKQHYSPNSVRRSKRLKHDQLKESDAADVEIFSNDQITSELPLIVSKSSNEISDEQICSSQPTKSISEKADNIVRTLRNKSFEIKEREIKAKTYARKKYKNVSMVQKSSRKFDHVQESPSITSVSRKVTRNKTILRKISSTRRTQHIRNNYPTRQRNRNLNKKPKRKKCSQSLWKNSKTETSKLGKEINVEKSKLSQETIIETAKTKNAKLRSPKRSIRISRHGSDGILASAIARREKNDITGFQTRLSRPIKLSAKMLANDELRYGFELQNNARLNVNSDVRDLSNEKELLKSDGNSLSPKTKITEEKIPTPVQHDSFPSKPLKNIQIKCPDPLEFLNEIKRNSLGSNKSPECNAKLTKLQQKRLLRLKEKHFFMLGLKKTSNKISLTGTNDKCIETISMQKEYTDTSSKTKVNNFTNARKGQNNYNMKIKTELSSQLSSEAHLHSKLICFCQKDTRYFTTKTQSRMYCTATDDIDGQLIGCNNELKGGLQNLLRPSNSASYQLLCLTHQRRLHHHGCCATCGVYCTQGYFVICSNKHLFHRECAEKFIINTEGKSSPIIPKLVLKCPHCGLENVIREYKLRLQKSLSFGIVTTRH